MKSKQEYICNRVRECGDGICSHAIDHNKNIYCNKKNRCNINSKCILKPKVKPKVYHGWVGMRNMHKTYNIGGIEIHTEYYKVYLEKQKCLEYYTDVRKVKIIVEEQ